MLSNYIQGPPYIEWVEQGDVPSMTRGRIHKMDPYSIGGLLHKKDPLLQGPPYIKRTHSNYKQYIRKTHIVQGLIYIRKTHNQETFCFVTYPCHCLVTSVIYYYAVRTVVYTCAHFICMVKRDLQCSTRREQKNVFVYCTFCFISPKPTVLWTCTMHHHDPLSSLIPQSPMASCHNNNV